jgi:hypothetical protein
VHVEVIEFVAPDGFENDIGRGVGGEADKADAALVLEFSRGVEAAVRAE